MQALGACAGIVLGRAIIRDVYEREAAARGLAIVMMVMTLAPAVSPTVGAYLAEWVDWRAIFVAARGARRGGVRRRRRAACRETNPTTGPGSISSAWPGPTARWLRSPAFVAFALCSACTSASWFTFSRQRPHVLSELLHQPPSTYGLMILLPMATYMLGNAIAARFAQRIGSLRLVLAGRAHRLRWRALAWRCGGGFGALSVWMLFVPIALASIGDGHDPAGGHGGGAQHPAAARRHRVGADGLSADDGRRRSAAFVVGAAAAPQRASG